MCASLNLVSGFAALCLSASLAGAALANDPPQTGTTGQPAAGSTPAPTSDQPVSNTAQTATVEKDEVVCKRVDAPTGSRAGAKKVCRTASEWRKLQEGARETVESVQSQGRAENPPGN